MEESEEGCVNLLYLASTKRDADQSVFNQEDTGSVQTGDADPSSQNAANMQQEAPPVASRLTKPASVSSDHRDVEQICPKVNCPEKIVICLDVSEEMEKVTFRSRAGDKFAPFKLVKRAVGIFLHSKHNLNAKHEFALVFLQEQAMWMHPFTSSPEKLLAILDDFEQVFATETFDMTSLFDVIQRHIDLPKISNPSLIPPPYTVRVLLLYGRSHCVPKFTNKQTLRLLLSSPHFFIDVFYIHEVPSEENQCETVYDNLCELDEKGLFYIFEVSKNPTRLYDCMAQLVAHPLQRPLQQDASYRLQDVEH